MAFRCEANEGYCETDYDNMSCDELCGLYAANAKCGLERCLVDAECEKKLSCPIRNADGSDSGQFYECTLPFACTAVSEALDDGSADVPKVCDENSTLPDAQLCAICDLAAGQS